MRARIGALAALAVLAAACTASGGGGGKPSPMAELRIGLLAPGTGATGLDAKRGAQLAADLLSDQDAAAPLPEAAAAGLPRLGGAKVEIFPADTRGDPARAAELATTLVSQDRVAALVGAYDTASTEAASKGSERLRVPFVDGDTSAGFLTQRALNWYFRVGPTDRMLGQAVFSALEQVPQNGRKVAILYVNDKPGNAVVSAAGDLAGEGGFTVDDKAVVGFAPGSDPTAAIAKIRAQSPDALFLVASSSADATSAIKALGSYSPRGVFTFGAGFLEPASLQATGQGGQGLFYSDDWSAEVATRNPAAKPILDLYQDRFRAPMTAVAASSYTAVMTLAAAVADASSVDPERVRSALLSLDLSGRETIMPWNGIRFDASHQNVRAAGVVEQRLQGSLHTVFPLELAKQKALWPLASARAA
jgi:branched-chain amino acid transport system substrate-binding protein